MKIKGVDIYYFDIPLQQPFKIAIGTVEAANNVLVRVQTDDNVTGLGESCPFAPITGETQETRHRYRLYQVGGRPIRRRPESDHFFHPHSRANQAIG